ncbi:MAG: hypothetical protein V1821_04595 [bacterium]
MRNNYPLEKVINNPTYVNWLDLHHLNRRLRYLKKQCCESSGQVFASLAELVQLPVKPE